MYKHVWENGKKSLEDAHTGP